MNAIRNVAAKDTLVLVSAEASKSSPAFEIHQFEGATWGPIVGEPEDDDILIDGVAFRREDLPVWDLVPLRGETRSQHHTVLVRLLRIVEERTPSGLSIYGIDRHERALKDAQDFVDRQRDDVFGFIGDEGRKPIVLVDDAVVRNVRVHVPEPTESTRMGREEFERDRWVRVMCDHSADGIWHKDGSAADLDALPVSPELRDRIRGWQDVFEKHAQDDGSVDEPLFGGMGLRIAQDVKSELPEWTVVYFDEDKYAKWRGKGLEGVSRGMFEYEIEMPSAAPASPR